MNRAGTDFIFDPFDHLPSGQRPRRDPMDLKLAFATLASRQYKAYTALMAEVNGDSRNLYNNPESPASTQHLFYLADNAGLMDIAGSLVHEWGKYDPEGQYRIRGYSSLRSWPDIESPHPYSIQIWKARQTPQSILGIFNIGGSRELRINHNNHTVLSTDGQVFKPGDWIADLLFEYARLRRWRDLKEASAPEPIAQPTRTLPPLTGVQPT